MTRSPGSLRPVSRFLLVAGLLFFVLALLSGETLLGWFQSEGGLSEAAKAAASHSRLWLAVVGVALLAGAAAARRMRIFERVSVTRATLLLCSLTLPLLAAELFLAPHVERGSSLYMRDSRLGWKHIPGARDVWHGVPVRINSMGLRGPERGHSKPPGVRRVLFLGDSVTFGFRNPDDSKVLPAQVEQRLNEALETKVECINAGVDGYSPWQSRIFLETEGLRYSPDLVVFSFVLNDVTEKMSLQLFGGEGEGYQLEHGAFGEGLNWIQQTNVGQFARRVGERLRGGADSPDGGLRPGELSAYELLLHPGSRPVRAAWQITLQNIERIVRICEKQKVPLLIVAFPYTIQVAKPEFDGPQRILGQFCEEQRVVYLDLQAPLVQELARLAQNDELFFMDAIHPTDAGYEFCAGELSRVIRREGWLGR